MLSIITSLIAAEMPSAVPPAQNTPSALTALKACGNVRRPALERDQQRVEHSEHHDHSPIASTVASVAVEVSRVDSTVACVVVSP